MPIDFNQSPYFDDYYEKDKETGKTPLDKGYYKILFQPSVAVQTRELNQLQTMIQTQIEKFGSHIFREGSLVLGGQFDYQRDVKYVKLNISEIEDFEDINFNDFIGKEVTGKNSSLKAFILATEEDPELNVQVLVIRYLNSALNNEGNEITEFLPSEELEIVSENTTFEFPVVGAAQDPTGNSSIFSIDEGVIFIKGYFVQFLKQTVIVEKYSSNPTKSIGLVIDRPLISTFLNDETLFDNARGSFNFTAPGADRLVLLIKLISTDNPESFADQDFSLIAKIRNGLIEDSKERPLYAEIYDEIAKRTFDESGDYYVKGLTVRTREAFDSGNNEGLDPNGSSDQLSVDIEPGLAYVKGYEINNLVTKHVLIDKGIDTKFVNNSLISARTGGFIVINEILGFPRVDQGTTIELYGGFDSDADSDYSSEKRITNSVSIGTEPTGQRIGEARIKTVLYNSGELGTAEGSLRLYLFDIRMDPGFIISDVISVYKENVFFADVQENSFFNTIENTLIYPVRTSNTKTIRRENSTEVSPLTDTNFIFYTSKTDASIPPNSKTITITVPPAQLAYGTGTLSDIEKQTIFVFKNSNGKHFDLKDPSVIVQINPGSIEIDLGDTFAQAGSSTSVTVIYKRKLPEKFEAIKTLTNVLVKIDYEESNAPATTTSPINLGLPDVWKIKEVRRKTGGEDFEDENDGEDVTRFFRLDNGQRDNFYDHAKLIPLSGITINPDDKLLIKLLAFETDGHSYFSVDSYPIDDSLDSENNIFTYEIPKYISSSGTVFNLRDSLDFRPYKTPTATYTSVFSNASENPEESSDDFILDIETSSTLLIPVPSTSINIDYSYYLARRDVLTVDQNGVFSVVKGVSSLAPISPTVSENVMALANIFIPPFPSISQTLARLIKWEDEFVTHQRVANRRYTMREIGALKTRVENLEYYNALNLLEKDTNDMLILDENGNNRFKNGFFVDGFLDHSLGATTNPDYNIAVDRIEQVIRPVFELDSFRYELASSGGLTKVGNLLHLPFTEEVLIDQPRVTTRRNVEQSVYRFIGQLKLTPDNDTWVDETVVDSNFEFGSNIENDRIINTEWGSWERHIVGYDVSRQAGAWTGLKLISGSKNATAQHVGAYTSYANATAAARAQASYKGFTGGRTQGVIETLEEDQRSGIQTSLTFEKEVQEIGNFITDVSVIPYIRPQGIEFYAQGLKPNTRHWLFFDGEEMTGGNYVKQFIDVDNPVVDFTNNSLLRTNEFGELRGILYLPVDGKRFRIGSKEIKIIDNPILSLDNITSIAENYFLASGLNVQKQNTILSTKTPALLQRETVVETSSRRVIDTQVIGPSCIAYTFRVDVPPENEGTFLTSVDLFFQELHPELGFRVQIRELNSAGNITQNVLPYSEVWVPRKVSNGNGSLRIDNPIIKTSENGSEATRINFEAPVFVYNDTSYAIVISAENINPDTYLWISRLGETDLITNQPVTSRPLTGAVFTTNNGVNWDIVPQTDLKIRFNRAKFETGTTEKQGFLKNKGYEFFTLSQNSSDNFEIIGENIIGSEKLNFFGASGSISSGQTITGQSSGTVAEIVGIQGNSLFTNGFGFEFDEQIVVSGTGVTATISNIFSGKGILRKFDQSKLKMQLSDTNGEFFNNGIVKGKISEKVAAATISLVDSFPYNSSIIKPDYLTFDKTQVTFEKRGRRNVAGNAFIPNYQDGAPDSTTNFEDELHILSKSREINLSGANKYSSEVRVKMKSETEYLSPIVDLSRANSVYIFNTINNDSENEDNPSGGNLINRYISKTVTLSDGQDAEDLAVYLTAYRPPGSDIKVWMKIKNDEDPESFSEKPWIEMIRNSDEFSSAGNEFDFRAYKFSVPPDNLDGGIIFYETDGESDGSDPENTFIRFKQFSIKIGILSTNSFIVPKVADLRAIALQL